jgi:hypothetical protein
MKNPSRGLKYPETLPGEYMDCQWLDVFGYETTRTIGKCAEKTV